MRSKNSMDEILKRLAEQKFALDQSAIVAQTNAKGTIQYVNDRFCDIAEYSREELIGKSHRIVNSGTHPKEFFQQMWHTISSGQVWRGDICNKSKSGRLYWVATTIVPFLDADGKPEQYLAIRQDITVLKEAEQKILQQQDMLVANSKLSAIGEMAAAITHEINNPLGVILGRCEMFKTIVDRGNVDVEKLKHLVDIIEINGKRIDKIVKSMRSLAHHGEQDPLLKTAIGVILQDLEDLFSERFRMNKIQLFIGDYDKNLSVPCRSHEVLQVLVNLFNNSFDAIQSLEEKWVRVTVNAQSDFIQISVTDSGKGIPESVLQKLFMPFFSTKRVQYGTGLGLSVSRSLIQKHHGKLEYDRNSPNTCFVITLPLN